MIDGLTGKQRAFLAAYRVCLSISGAARAADIGNTSHYKWLLGENYAAAFYQSHQQVADALEAEAIRRAVDGERELQTYQGEPIFVYENEAGEVVPKGTRGAKKVALYQVKRSDQILQLLLKAKKPDEYRERTSQEISGPGGGPVETRLVIVEEANWYGNANSLPAESAAAPSANLDQSRPV